MFVVGNGVDAAGAGAFVVGAGIAAVTVDENFIAFGVIVFDPVLDELFLLKLSVNDATSESVILSVSVIDLGVGGGVGGVPGAGVEAGGDAGFGVGIATFLVILKSVFVTESD